MGCVDICKNEVSFYEVFLTWSSNFVPFTKCFWRWFSERFFTMKNNIWQTRTDPINRLRGLLLETSSYDNIYIYICIYMAVRQFARTLCHLVRGPVAPQQVRVHKVGVHKVGGTRLGGNVVFHGISIVCQTCSWHVILLLLVVNCFPSHFMVYYCSWRTSPSAAMTTKMPQEEHRNPGKYSIRCSWRTSQSAAMTTKMPPEKQRNLGKYGIRYSWRTSPVQRWRQRFPRGAEKFGKVRHTL